MPNQKSILSFSTRNKKRKKAISNSIKIQNCRYLVKKNKVITIFELLIKEKKENIAYL